MRVKEIKNRKRTKSVTGARGYRRTIALRCLILFGIVFGMGLLILAKQGAEPFGSGSMYVLDLADQYVPMYHRLANIHSIQELFYSWSGALGYNAWAEMAYYGDSIFVLFLRGLNDMQMMTAVDLICVLKPALAAVTCLLYLEYRFDPEWMDGAEIRQKKNTLPVLLMGCAAAYAMCGWSYSYMMETIWTDILILLPVMMIGFERLLQSGRGIFYSVMLALILAANFYIGYMVCLFLVLYFLNRLIISAEGRKDAGRQIIRFIFYSILGAALAAVILLPAAIALGKTISIQDAPKAFKWYENAAFYLARMMPSQDAALWDRGVNIATGILALFLVPMYFCSSRYTLREKITDAGLLAVLFLSMNINFTNYIWHGFHMPRFLPGRWTFLFSFFVIGLEAKAWAGLPETGRRGRRVSAAAGVCLAVCGGIAGAVFGQTVRWIFYVLLGLAIVLTFMLRKETPGTPLILSDFLRRRTRPEDEEHVEKRKRRISGMRLAAVLLAAVQIADVGINYIDMVGSSDGQTLTYAKADNYAKPIASIRKTAEEIRSEDKDWYRISLDPGAVDTLPDVVGYSGITYFSSMMNGSVYKWFSWLGMPYTTKEISVSAENSSPVFTGIHDLRYLGYFWRKRDTVIPYGEQVKSTQTERIYRNPYALSLSFGVSGDLLSIAPEESDPTSGLLHQNDLISAMCGEKQELFHREALDVLALDNISLTPDQTKSEDLIQQGSWKTKKKKKTSSISWTLQADSDGPVYISTTFDDGMLYAWINGELTLSEGVRYPQYRCVGTAKAGDEVSVTYVPYGGTNHGEYGICAYQLDETALDTAFSRLRETQMEIHSFSATELSGTVTADERQLMFTSIPEDGGWSVYIDGKETDTIVLCGAMVGYYVPAGEHEVRFRYRVPGLAQGAAVSAAALAVCVLIWYISRKRGGVGA